MSKTPSIAVIPSGYKASKVYSVLPTNGDADLDFTRNCEATRVNQNGLIETVGLNVPRLDYSDGGCPSLLLEPQRTNQFLQSNQFDTSWSTSGTIISGQSGVGGSNNAWKHTNSSQSSGLTQVNTVSGEQTVSIYFKKNADYGVRIFAFGDVNCSSYFDLDNGLVVSESNSNSKIEIVDSEWFRCSMTFNQTNTQIILYTTDNSTNQVVGDITIQYSQLEEGSYATSYISTSASPVTRFKDEASKDNLESYINSSEGVLYFDSKVFDDNINRWISLSDGTQSNVIEFRYTSVDNQIRCKYTISSSVNADLITLVSDSLQFNKFAFKWKNNDFSLWVNGVEVDNEIAGVTTSFNVTTLSFNLANIGSTNFQGKVKDLRVYNEALTDAELIELTTI